TPAVLGNVIGRRKAMCATAANVRRATSFNVFGIGVFVLVCLGTAGAADQYVNWTHRVNVRPRGNALVKTGGCDGCDDAGAISEQMLESGDGYAEFRVTDPYAYWVAGLSSANGNARFDQIDFAFRFNGDGRTDVLEDGVFQEGADTTCAAGDVFRVAV